MEVFFYVERVKLIRVCQKQRELSMLHTYKDSLKEFWLIHKHIHVNVKRYLSSCDLSITIYANCLKIDPEDSFRNLKHLAPNTPLIHTWFTY